MARIFLSYAREDQPAARRIVDALAREGLEAWWDHQIPPGRSWDEVIGARIDSADAVIVLWSTHSVASDFVKEEAQLAFSAGKFLPVLVDSVEPPMGFRRVHAANLANWRGDAEDQQWRALLGELRARLGAPAAPKAALRKPGTPNPPPNLQAPSSSFRVPPLLIAAALGAFALIGVGAMVYASNNNGGSPREQIYAGTDATGGSTIEISNEYPQEGPTFSGPAPASSGASDLVNDLLGAWTRTSGTVCRENYAFRKVGNQIVWSQNEDQYTRNYSVENGRVALDSTWRFEPRGNSLTIYDSGERICTFRRGRAPASTPPPPSSAASASIENLLGWWTRTSGTVCRESYGFRRQGSQIVWNQNEDEYTRTYSLEGGMIALDSTWRFDPRGNTLTIYNEGQQICTFRRGRAPTPAAPPQSAASASGALQDLLGWWTRTSGTRCRDSYGFRMSGNQVIWTQNEDEYTRNYTVSGGIVGLDSTWRFEPRGNTLTIYDGSEQVCTFRRGRASASAPSSGASSGGGALQALMGRWTRTSGDRCRDNYGFRMSGSIVIWSQNEDEYERAYAVSGGIVTLSSTWRFEPRGNTLIIYDGSEQVCTFRRVS